MLADKLPRNTDGTLSKYAWPGGYPIIYICADGGVLCPKCANENAHLSEITSPDWHVVAADVNWEDPYLHCDNCSQRIESAYAG
jgi:hypothetical protein